MRIIDIIIDPAAQDPDNVYEKIRWKCAGCDHGNINELSKTKIENWEMKDERVYLSWNWDCKWCRRTNLITVGFDRSGEKTRYTMSEEDWKYLEALMDSFGNFLSIIPYGHRDKAWWDKFREFDDKIKEQIKKVQPLKELT